MRTERLHYDDPLCLQLEARVIAHDAWKGAPTLILDRTVFYPESGGQMGDHGVIDEARVSDTQIDDEGRVHHLIEGALPAVGAVVTCRVDEARRRQHMALHSAQHALSRAVLDDHGAVTLSSRLGETGCTLDVDVDGLTLEALAPTEARVNALVDADRPVRQYFPTDAELARLELRKPAPDTERVRVVAIEGWDTTPCGGTHVTHSAQIELLWIHGVERYKGGTRISFEAGPRARRKLAEESRHLRQIAGRLRCAALEVGGIVAGLGDKLDEARQETGRVRAQLANQWAERLDDGGDEIVAVLEPGDRALLEVLSERLLRPGRLVALATPGPDGTDVLISRGEGVALHCGQLVKALAKEVGGGGGGRPERAQGRLAGGIDWQALVRGRLAARAP